MVVRVREPLWASHTVGTWPREPTRDGAGCHDLSVTEYSWPDWGSYRAREDLAANAWKETIRNLPLASSIAGEVIGRQPFGVFIHIDHHPEAIGLAEITAMPRCAALPRVGERVSGTVLWHADHNHQVKIQLEEWVQHQDLLPRFADRVGQTVAGRVTKLASIGVFVRLADCVEGLVRTDVAAPARSVHEGEDVMVRILAVDLERRQVSLTIV